MVGAKAGLVAGAEGPPLAVEVAEDGSGWERAGANPRSVKDFVTMKDTTPVIRKAAMGNQENLFLGTGAG